MAMLDVNALFARAETDFRNARLDAARSNLLQILRAVGEHASVLHLLALVESKAGRTAQARAVFARALTQTPNDPQINNNYANLLDAAGDAAGALVHYDRALAAAPAFMDARLNKAITLQALGRLDDSLSELNLLIAADPRNISARTTRGAALRLLGRRREADVEFATALTLNPSCTAALHGRARIAAESGREEDAIAWYRQAISTAPDDPELAMGMAEELEAAGMNGGIAMLADAVDRNPLWLKGQDSLARMLSEAGDTDFAAGYARAIIRHPRDPVLHMAHWQCLARGNRHSDALAAIDRARSMIAWTADMALTEAVLAGETGDLKRADKAFATVPDTPQARLARGRHALRSGDPEKAVALLKPMAMGDLRSVNAWAHLSLAWRLLDDPRHEWLCMQPGLFATQDLPMDDAALTHLADTLRGLHRAKAHPIGQSLRGGTQTRGRLLDRHEPAIGTLKQLLIDAIGLYRAALPAADARHPLLAFRNSPFSFYGSWSVRLTGGGFHVQHVHPEGVLSSACYIALPPVSGGQEKAGWLDIGAPPAELALDIPALAVIEPKPGRLALFPSYLFHGTRPFTVGERLTVAFDVVA
ncbi:tetratricopeptide repeat protein [Sphingobium sp. CR2-8]|uniref:2OG-Fe(II) oxygenase family protein n=1 Tax=Sphingobium sp. CR2-8 TaxID=1306534 RepID=UPI002DB80EAB|nr:tetratricopeptide repeat protein [Sphingobium sp. CR2-8]MEC3912751.1 tetratricopeptide repeat protein [Sphingobium sp. CR2-8]